MPIATPLQHSAVYEGTIMHLRLAPKRHRFNYRICMVYLDLGELERVFAMNPLWSMERFNLASFHRADYLGDPKKALKAEVSKRIFEETGKLHTGPVRMLTNLRYWGHIINPITCYYCFDESERLDYIVAEVTNTPWGERHSYVLSIANEQTLNPAASADGVDSGVIGITEKVVDEVESGAVQPDEYFRTRFAKQMHVSPFMPMDMEYFWKSSTPDAELNIYMENIRQQQKAFVATLCLHKKVLNSAAMSSLIWRYPVMTLKVAFGIYFEALRLWCKGIGFHPHPERRSANAGTQAGSISLQASPDAKATLNPKINKPEPANRK